MLKKQFKKVMGGFVVIALSVTSCKKEAITPSTTSPTNTSSEVFAFDVKFGSKNYSWKGTSKGDTTTKAICEINDTTALVAFENEAKNFLFSVATKDKKFENKTFKKGTNEMYAPEIFIIENGMTGYFVAKNDDYITVTYSKIPSSKGSVLKGTIKGKVSTFDMMTNLPSESVTIEGSFNCFRVN